MNFPSPYDNVLPDKMKLTDPPVPPSQKKSDSNRFIGSLVGLAVGDALGASVEFRPYTYFIDHPVKDMEGGGTWGLKAGQWTDDTSMALCLASSLIDKRRFDPYDQMVRYKWWHKYGYMSSTGQCFDIGNATREALEEFSQRQKILSNFFHCTEEKDLDNLSWDKVQSVKEFDINCSSPGVAGNGALMRLAAVPLFFSEFPDIAIEYAGISARLTHGDQKAVDACRYYAALIVAAIHGKTKNELLQNNFYERHREWFGSIELHEDILRVAHGSYKQKNGYDDGIRGKGYIVSALEAALWAFWSDEDSFEKGALAAVNLGDDTDTTAAIYGQLAGAYYGYERLPKKWLKKLYAHDLLVCVGRWLYYEGKQYKVTKEDQKNISSIQNPSIAPSIKHQGVLPDQSPRHVSVSRVSDPRHLNNDYSLRDQPSIRDLPVNYHGSSRHPIQNPRNADVLSYQPSTYDSSRQQIHFNQSHMRQQPRERFILNPSDLHSLSESQSNYRQPHTQQRDVQYQSSSFVDNHQPSIYRSEIYHPFVNDRHISQRGLPDLTSKQSSTNQSYIRSPRPSSSERVLHSNGTFNYPYSGDQNQVPSSRNDDYRNDIRNQRYTPETGSYNISTRTAGYDYRNSGATNPLISPTRKSYPYDTTIVKSSYPDHNRVYDGSTTYY